jgi:3-methyladenine DNA glycosylase/8-oxoguanine DNA glycosylase
VSFDASLARAHPGRYRHVEDIRDRRRTNGRAVAAHGDRDPPRRPSCPPRRLGAAVVALPVELRVEVIPRWSFRLPTRGGRDGVLRCRGRVLERLLHVGGRPAIVRVAQTAQRRVLFGCWARDRGDAEAAIARMRFALAVDDDLREFYERFRDDPLIGASLRRTPWLRIARRPVAFEAVAWAVCEQLIESGRAAAIERRIVHALGPRCAHSGLRDVPSAAALAACAPARLESFDLAARRAIALVRVAGQVSAGGLDLDGPDHERSWRRLLAVPTIGRWTVEMLATHGQGRYDALAAGDLGYLKLLGGWRSGGDPAARAEEADVRALFERFGPWRGLAGQHALRSPPPPLRELVAAA